jgi:hypothetical protein
MWEGRDIADNQCLWQSVCRQMEPSKSRSRMAGGRSESENNKVQDVVARCVGIGTKTRQVRTRVIGHAQNHHVHKVLSDTEVQVVEIPGAQVRVRVRPMVGSLSFSNHRFYCLLQLLLEAPWHIFALFVALMDQPQWYVTSDERHDTQTSPSDLALGIIISVDQWYIIEPTHLEAGSMIGLYRCRCRLPYGMSVTVHSRTWYILLDCPGLSVAITTPASSCIRPSWISFDHGGRIRATNLHAVATVAEFRSRLAWDDHPP